MINRAIIIAGNRWGQRLREHLNKPPLGVGNWLRQRSRVLKDERAKIVGLVELRRRPCCLKLYRGRPPGLQLLCLLRLGRPMSTYRTGLKLAAQGVPVPRPFSCVIVFEGVLLLTEGLPQEGEYSRLWQAVPGREQALGMMRAAGETIADLHGAGYTHGDCKWNNLVWSEQTCFLVDLDGARRSRFPAARRRARDIARFAVSAEEAGVSTALLDEFLDSYLRRSGEDRDKLRKRMQPHLTKLRHRHRERYGVEPQPLL